MHVTAPCSACVLGQARPTMSCNFLDIAQLCPWKCLTCGFLQFLLLHSSVDKLSCTPASYTTVLPVCTLPLLCTLKVIPLVASSHETTHRGHEHQLSFSCISVVCIVEHNACSAVSAVLWKQYYFTLRIRRLKDTVGIAYASWICSDSQCFI